MFASGGEVTQVRGSTHCSAILISKTLSVALTPCVTGDTACQVTLGPPSPRGIANNRIYKAKIIYFIITHINIRKEMSTLKNVWSPSENIFFGFLDELDNLILFVLF